VEAQYPNSERELLMLSASQSSRGKVFDRVSPHRGNRAGFTLIELALVSLILLVMLNVSLPLFRNTLRAIRVEHAAREVSQLIWYLRERSVVEGRRHRLVFDFEGGSYRTEVEEGGVENAIFFRPLREDIGGRHRLDRTIALDGEDGEIDFYPDGRIDDAIIRLSESSGLSWEIRVEGSVVRLLELKEGS